MEIGTIRPINDTEKLPLTLHILQLTCSSFSDLVQGYFMKCNGRNYKGSGRKVFGDATIISWGTIRWSRQLILCYNKIYWNSNAAKQVGESLYNSESRKFREYTWLSLLAYTYTKFWHSYLLIPTFSLLAIGFLQLISPSPVKHSEKSGINMKWQRSPRKHTWMLSEILECV